MTRLIIVLWIVLPLGALCQVADPLIFREKTFDFGEIAESNGKADHEFVFTNNSGRPVKILTVNASCGCTTPGWSQEPIPNGKAGFIKASFDPRGRPGYFNKSLTVVTDFDANTIVLQIKGTVVTGNAAASVDLPIAFGNLYFQAKSFNMATVYINKLPAVKQFYVMNKSTSPVKFLSVSKPAYIKVDMPTILAPQEKGIIKVSYDGMKKNQFGFASDNIQITTTDTGNEIKSISVFALLEEYYAIPTGDEAAKAPVLFIRNNSLDLGRFALNASIDQTIMLKNAGKKELKIKAVQANCTCVAADIPNKTVRPGDSTALKILFKPQSRGGTQQKAITVYSNDPRNPVQRILLSAFIEEE